MKKNLGIKDKIKDIVDKYNIRLVDDLDIFFDNIATNGKRFFYSKADGANGQQYFFKILVSEDKSDFLAMKNEILANRFISSRNFHSFKMSEMLHSEIGDYVWYIRDYADGELFSDTYAINKIDTGNLQKLVRKSILSLAEFSLQKDESFEKYSSRTYIDGIRRYEKVLTPNFPGLLLKFETMLGVVDSLSGQELAFCHGDYHLNNILLSEHDIFIIDWAHAHIGNNAEDFAKIYLSLWQYPLLQQESANLYFKGLTQENIKLFLKLIKPMLLYHGSDGFRHWMKHRSDSGNNEAEAGFQYFNSLLINLLEGNVPSYFQVQE